MKLSVICPALLSRSHDAPILDSLRAQIQGKPAELIVLSDDGKMPIGTKLNHLLRCVTGEYVTTVADDDVVPEDYVDTLLDATGTTDVVTFNVNWQAGEPFLDWPVETCNFRPIAAVRSAIATQFVYPAWSRSEDRAFRRWLRSRQPSVLHLDKILYGYCFRQAKPEFGGLMYAPGCREASRGDVQRVLVGQVAP